MSIYLIWFLFLKQCGECMDTNEAYCVDENSYYLCFDGKNPSTTELHHCAEGEVCTTTEKICEPKNGTNGVQNPVCGGSCGKCPIKGRYTCVSKTQFGRCLNGVITVVSSCESGHICSSELYEQTNTICAPECVANFVSSNRN